VNKEPRVSDLVTDYLKDIGFVETKFMTKLPFNFTSHIGDSKQAHDCDVILGRFVTRYFQIRFKKAHTNMLIYSRVSRAGEILSTAEVFRREYAIHNPEFPQNMITDLMTRDEPGNSKLILPEEFFE